MSKAKTWNRRVSLFALLAALALVVSAFLTDRMWPVLKSMPMEYLTSLVMGSVILGVLFAFAAAFCHCAYLNVLEMEDRARRNEKNRARIVVMEAEMVKRRSFWDSLINN